MLKSKWLGTCSSPHACSLIYTHNLWGAALCTNAATAPSTVHTSSTSVVPTTTKWPNCLGCVLSEKNRQANWTEWISEKWWKSILEHTKVHLCPHNASITYHSINFQNDKSFNIELATSTFLLSTSVCYKCWHVSHCGDHVSTSIPEPNKSEAVSQRLTECEIPNDVQGAIRQPPGAPMPIPQLLPSVMLQIDDSASTMNPTIASCLA